MIDRVGRYAHQRRDLRAQRMQRRRNRTCSPELVAREIVAAAEADDPAPRRELAILRLLERQRFDQREELGFFSAIDEIRPVQETGKQRMRREELVLKLQAAHGGLAAAMSSIDLRRNTCSNTSETMMNSSACVSRARPARPLRTVSGEPTIDRASMCSA